MRGKNMARRITDVASRTGEPILKQPLLELCSDRRILIEHHRGIGAYSSTEISVKVKFGSITICGTGLEICRMTGDQLVIAGSVEAVTLIKGSDL